MVAADFDDGYGSVEDDLPSNWLGDTGAVLLEEDVERNEKQARRNLKIRGLLQSRRDTQDKTEATSARPAALDEIAMVGDTPKKTDESTGEETVPPWFVFRDEPKAVCLRLHEELLDFAAFMRPTPPEAEARHCWFAVIETSVKSLWVQAEVLIFGSSSTGLSLPSADVDVAISGVELRPTTAMKQLAERLLEQEAVSKVEIIQSAKVPVMKIQQRSSGLMADIVVNRMDGLETSSFIREQCETFPALAPMVLFLKLFLAQRNLHETFLGGMGSYLLVCVVLSFLQQHPSARNPRAHAVTNLGNLLLDFFKYYSQEFRYATTGISVLNGGALFDRQKRGWTAKTRTGQPTLCLESPTETTIDIGTKVHKIGIVRAAFNHAYHVLSKILLSKEIGGGSLLCPYLIRYDHAVVSNRHDILKEQAAPLVGASGRPDSDDEDEPDAKRPRLESGKELHVAEESVVPRQASPTQTETGQTLELTVDMQPPDALAGAMDFLVAAETLEVSPQPQISAEARAIAEEQRQLQEQLRLLEEQEAAEAAIATEDRLSDDFMAF